MTAPAERRADGWRAMIEAPSDKRIIIVKTAGGVETPARRRQFRSNSWIDLFGRAVFPETWCEHQ